MDHPRITHAASRGAASSLWNITKYKKSADFRGQSFERDFFSPGNTGLGRESAHSALAAERADVLDEVSTD